MNNFIRAIYHDLLSRVKNLIHELEAREIHPEIDVNFVENTKSNLHQLSKEITYRIESGDLEEDGLRRNNLRRYSSLQERFQLLEAYPYQVILKYQEPEVYLNKKVHLIYEQIRCLHEVPIITTISNFEQYYWAHPYYNIIAVPLGEEKNLLNLPDLYHEIAHLIFLIYKNYLLGDFLSDLSTYVEEEKRIIEEEDLGEELSKELDDAHELWIEHWLEEFVCDLIATFLVGEAYGWSNLKISSIHLKDVGIYQSFPAHPADEARMRMIFKMLDKLNLPQEDLQHSWDSFRQLVATPKPRDYDILYPDHLLEKLTDYVFQGCQDIDLASYIEQVETDEVTVAEILNEAWVKIRTDSNGYPDWQINTINELREKG